MSLQKLTNFSGSHIDILRGTFPTLTEFDKPDILKIIASNISALCDYIKGDMDTDTLVTLADDIHGQVYFIKAPEIKTLFEFLKQAKYIMRSASEISRHVETWCDKRALIAENDAPKEEILLSPNVKNSWYETVKKHGIQQDATDRKKEAEEKKVVKYKDSIGSINECEFCGLELYNPITGQSTPHDMDKCKDEMGASNTDDDLRFCAFCGSKIYDEETGLIIPHKCKK